MSRCRIVVPEVVRIPLSDGDWIEVKKRLNAGEQRAMFASMYLAGGDGQVRVNPVTYAVAQMTAYLVDWSMVGLDGKIIPIAGKAAETVAAAINLLDGETNAEIQRAIAAHEEAMTEARAQEKKDRDGATNGSAISPSPSAPAGPSTMSVN
jgi:hypothetical protein